MKHYLCGSWADGVRISRVLLLQGHTVRLYREGKDAFTVIDSDVPLPDFNFLEKLVIGKELTFSTLMRLYLDWLKQPQVVPPNRIPSDLTESQTVILLDGIINRLWLNEDGTWNPDKLWGPDAIEDIAVMLRQCDLNPKTVLTGDIPVEPPSDKAKYGPKEQGGMVLIKRDQP